MSCIALTGRDRPAMNAVAELLTARISVKGLAVTLFLDVRDAGEAQAIQRKGSELWRVGQDLTRPDLDQLVARHIDTSCSQAQLTERVDHAFGLFLGKAGVSA